MAGSASTTSTSTNVTYTPEWRFSEPWVLADNQISSVVIQLEANLTSPTVPTPTDIVTHGAEVGTLSIVTSPPQSVSPEQSSTVPATTSHGTATSSLSDPVVQSSATFPSVTLSSQASTDNNFSSPTIAATQTSPSLFHTNSPSSKDKPGLSLGETVGIAIGCLFLGAALAILAACVFIWRKKRSGVPSSQRSGSKSSMSEKLIDRKSPPIVMENIERPPPYMRFETLLARPSSDEELVAMFTQLNTSIADYAQRCTSTGSQSLATEIDWARALDEVLGPEPPMSVKKMSALLQHSQTRGATLRHIIAWSILQNVRSLGAPETTLLPPEISECMSSMAGMQGDAKGKAAQCHVVNHRLTCRRSHALTREMATDSPSADGANIRKRERHQSQRPETSQHW
jgi:hypothetical protein